MIYTCAGVPPWFSSSKRVSPSYLLPPWRTDAHAPTPPVASQGSWIQFLGRFGSWINSFGIPDFGWFFGIPFLEYLWIPEFCSFGNTRLFFWHSMCRGSKWPRTSIRFWNQILRPTPSHFGTLWSQMECFHILSVQTFPLWGSPLFSIPEGDVIWCFTPKMKPLQYLAMALESVIIETGSVRRFGFGCGLLQCSFLGWSPSLPMFGA